MTISKTGMRFGFLVVVIVVLLNLIWITYSAIEARQYNRLTGGNATTLDAMFIQLRVQGKEKE